MKGQKFRIKIMKKYETEGFMEWDYLTFKFNRIIAIYTPINFYGISVRIHYGILRMLNFFR